MASAAGVAAVLLPHVSLLLTLLGGAGMAMAARLKWDPSLYIAVRELMPTEYRVLAGVLTAGSLVLLLLAHLAACALAAPLHTPLRRILFIMYAVGMAAMVVTEVAVVSWAAQRAVEWLNSEQMQAIQEAMELRHDLHKMFEFLGRFHSLPERIKELLKEAEEDLPKNLYCAGSLAALTVLLQLAGVVLAALAACAVPPRFNCSTHSSETSLLRSSKCTPRAKVRAVYRNGRLEIV